MQEGGRRPPPGWRALGAAVALVPLVACSGDGGGPAAEITAEIDVDPHVGPDVVVTPDGDVWLPASDTFGGSEVPYDEAANLVVRIDGSAGRVVAAVAVDRPMVAVAAGAGGVWAAGTDFGPGDTVARGSAVRIDPARNQVDLTVDFGDGSSPSDIVVGHGAVWVSDSTADAVYRVDPATGAVTDTVAVEGGPTSLAIAGGAVWVAKPGTAQVRPIDPDTRAPGKAVSAGSNPSVLAGGESDLFVADYAENRVARVDTRRGRVEETVSFPTAPSRLAVGPDVVVVAEVEGRELSVVRGADRQVILTGRMLVALALDAAGSTVWAADAGRGAVLRISIPER